EIWSSPTPPPASPRQSVDTPPAAPLTLNTARSLTFALAPDSTEMMPPPPPPPQSSAVVFCWNGGAHSPVGSVIRPCVSPPSPPAALTSAVAPIVALSPATRLVPPAPPPPGAVPVAQPPSACAAEARDRPRARERLRDAAGMGILHLRRRRHGGDHERAVVGRRARTGDHDRLADVRGREQAGGIGERDDVRGERERVAGAGRHR